MLVIGWMKFEAVEKRIEKKAREKVISVFRLKRKLLFLMKTGS